MSLLTINCIPACIVLLNGRRFGVTPIKNKPVAPGKHRVTAYREDVGGKSFDITLKPGVPAKYEIKMYER